MLNISLDMAKFYVKQLDTMETLTFMKWLFDREPHKWDYVTMCEPLQRFHNPDAKRS